MIKAVTVKNFKRFREQRFDLSENVVLAGPNNFGKTTLLQAIVIWDLALRKWRERRGPQSDSRARERTGVPLTRAELTALPLREMDLLWFNRRTALRKAELTGEQKPGHPRTLDITVEGEEGGRPWELTMEFRYHSTEMAYVRPVQGTVPEPVERIQIVHVPPFSGIGVEEPEYKREYQNRLIGQGKPGEVLRNLLVEVHDKGADAWGLLCQDILEIFRCELHPPQHKGLPVIVCEYTPQTGKKAAGGGGPPLDIASAGSGFHQVLLLLAFVYARPATVFLLDEPDAHLHVVLQKQIYDRLRSTFARQRSQLVIATHSEVLIDDTDPQAVLSFYGRPHRLMQPREVEQVREALKRLSAMDLLLAEDAKGILYLESQDDFNLLQAWAKVLEHPLYKRRWFAESPFWHPNNGRHPREAREHFFAMRAIHSDFRGYLLLDGDNRGRPNHEIDADGLAIGRWSRYEAESYLVHPAALRRFLAGRVPGDLFLSKAVEYLENALPPAVLRAPAADHDYLVRTPASKTILSDYFRAAQDPLTKKEYYLVAEQMLREEIPPEVQLKLDEIAAALGIPKA